ncbi:MAG: NYN domain-containing protein [Candidatus Melainabacteria bacterium]|nr:NYN domain-containing protein [Candidatus Melainabacteria bacterium]
MPPRLCVYIDGFNFYYGALVDKPQYKWLNPEALVYCFFPKEKNTLVEIKYFSAQVKALPYDPHAPERQKTYWKALESLSCFRIIEGKFVSRTQARRLVVPPHYKVDVFETTEKETDVNLAVHLLNDAHLNRYDLAIVISNDSDLVEAVRLVRKDVRKKVCVLRHRRNRGTELIKAANFSKTITEEHLAQAQFPETITLADGTSVSRPSLWSHNQ